MSCNDFKENELNNLSNRVFDVVVYGGSSAGVVAAVQAARMNMDVLLICEKDWIGGMTASGLGAADLNDRNYVGGITREFFCEVYRYYLNEDVWKSETLQDYLERLARNKDTFWGASDNSMQMMWMFEPSAAMNIFEKMLDDSEVHVIRNERLAEKAPVEMTDRRIQSIRMESGRIFKGKIFIDCGYEGDLMQRAGISYVVGREANTTYGEQKNGILYNGLFMGTEIDPYIIEGSPESGILPYIEEGTIGGQGMGDHRIQAYCYRFTLSCDPVNQIPISKPSNYNPLYYEMIARVMKKKKLNLTDIISLTPVPNCKTDTNHADFIGACYDYPDGDYEKRRQIEEEHKNYTLGLLWFLSNDPRVPENIRKEMKMWGFPKDEFKDSGSFPWQIYVREGRRMLGSYIMTENDILNPKVTDSIGMGTYYFDSHYVSRFAMGQSVMEEGSFWLDDEVRYPISYGAICPKAKECKNLLVPVALSASHAAYGSIRMEPTYMVLAQSAATAAALAVSEGSSVQVLCYDKLKPRLLQDGVILNKGEDDDET
jgi:hypothetical protein